MPVLFCWDRSIVSLVDHHLREGDLHAVVVKQDLQVPRQHPLAGKHVLLCHVHGEFQVHPAVGQRVHAEIARRREIQVRVFLPQSGQLLLQHLLQLAQVGRIGDRRQHQRHGVVA